MLTQSVVDASSVNSFKNRLLLERWEHLKLLLHKLLYHQVSSKYVAPHIVANIHDALSLGRSLNRP